jgi:ABC-type molybdate transport system substrate-binding protein
MNKLPRRFFLAASLVAGGFLAVPALAQSAGGASVTILTVPAMAEPVRAILGRHQRLIIASSDDMPIKIESEIAADILITEDTAQIREFSEIGRIVPDSIVPLAQDRIVLVQRSDLARVAVIRPGLEFRYVVEDGRFGLLSDVAGVLGDTILTAAKKLELLRQLGDRVDKYDDPLQLVQALQRGDVAAGFLPHSMTGAYSNLEVVGTVPDYIAPSLTYTGGILEGRDRPAVRAAYARLFDSEAFVTLVNFGLRKPSLP